MSVKKKGRPRKREAREEMTKVYSFRADRATEIAIAKLVDSMREDAPIGIAQSSLQAGAIRRGLQLAAGMIKVSEET